MSVIPIPVMREAEWIWQYLKTKRG